jgi:hypothetical protein
MKGPVASNTGNQQKEYGDHNKQSNCIPVPLITEIKHNLGCGTVFSFALDPFVSPGHANGDEYKSDNQENGKNNVNKNTCIGSCMFNIEQGHGNHKENDDQTAYGGEDAPKKGKGIVIVLR